MPIPDDTCAIIQLTDNVAKYMAAKYLQSKQPSLKVPIPPGWTERMTLECDHAVDVVLVAVQNRGKASLDLTARPTFTIFVVSTDWDVDRYSTRLSPRQSGQNFVIEELQEDRFPPIFTTPFPVFMHPNILTDCHGNILVWHLPDILSVATQVCDLFKHDP